MARINVPILLLSIALSTSAWFILYGQNLATVGTASVLLTSSNAGGLPDKLFIDQINHQQRLLVRLSGPTGQVQAAHEDPDMVARHISIDLSNAVPGEKGYPLVYDRNIANIVTDPTSVPVKIQKIITKSVQIRVETRGKLQDASSSLTSANTEETVVNVQGPSSWVDKVKEARALLKLNEVDVNNPGKVEATLTAVDDNDQPVDNVQLEKSSVVINPIIGAAQVDKTVLVSADIRGQVAPGYEAIGGYKITPPEIHLSGLSSTLVNTSQVTTETVDLTGLTQTKLFKVRIITPRGTSSRTNVAYVRVTVQPDKTLKHGTPTKPPSNGFPAQVPPITTGGRTGP